jgi:hypothetical protein
LSFDKLNLQNQATNSHLNTIALNTATSKSETKDTSKDIQQVNSTQQHTNTALDGIRANLAAYYTGSLNQSIAANTHLTSIQTTATLINNTGLPTITRAITSGVAGIEATENAGFKAIDGSIASHSSAIVGAINSAAASIIEDAREARANSCGGGSAFDFGNGAFGGNTFTPIKLPDHVGKYASGGDFVTNGPKIIQVGEAGPERVTITPLSDTRPSNLGISLETSYASKQLSDLMTKIANSPVTIPVKLELDADSYDLKQMIEEAVRGAIRDIRVR